MELAALHYPFLAAEIEWRVGSTNADKTSGLALAYLTARHVMDRLDDVCGSENWQDRYEFHGARTICYLSIRINDEWVTKADGAGDSDVEAEKGAISDALKRAAVKWGIGRYLYDLGNIWVDVEPAGRSVRIKKDQYRKLQDILDAQFGPTKMQTPTPPKPSARPLETAKSEHKTFDEIFNAIFGAEDMKALQEAFEWAKGNPNIDRKAGQDLIEAKDQRKEQLVQATNKLNPNPGYVAPNFEGMQQ